MRRRKLRWSSLLRLRHALPKRHRALGIIAAFRHHEQTQAIGFGFHLPGAGALDGEVEDQGGDLGGGVQGVGEEEEKGDDVGHLADLFAGVVGYVVRYFVAEDGGEAVFVGADGEYAAEDEDIAAVGELDTVLRRGLREIDGPAISHLLGVRGPCLTLGLNGLTHPGRTKAFFCSLSPMTLTSHPPSRLKPLAGISRSMTLCTILESGCSGGRI